MRGRNYNFLLIYQEVTYRSIDILNQQFERDFFKCGCINGILQTVPTTHIVSRLPEQLCWFCTLIAL